MSYDLLMFGAPASLSDRELLEAIDLSAVVVLPVREAGRRLRWCQLLTEHGRARSEDTVARLARGWGSVIVVGASDRGGPLAFVHRHADEGEVRTTDLAVRVSDEGWDLDGEPVPQEADVLETGMRSIVGRAAAAELAAMRRAEVAAGAPTVAAYRVAPGTAPERIELPQRGLPQLLDVGECAHVELVDGPEEEDELLVVRAELRDPATREEGLSLARAMRARGELGAVSAEIATLEAAGRWDEVAEAALSWADAVADERAGMAIAWTAHKLAQSGRQAQAAALVRAVTAYLPGLAERLRRNEVLAPLVG